jgi:glycosyltransferase involved in cell wall biosynthesis
MGTEAGDTSSLGDSRWGDRALRVLMWSECFPKPTIPNMGLWALDQALGLAAVGAEVRVISPTSWIPPLLRSHPAARRFNDCPASHVWDGIPIQYPRWPFYSAPIVRRLWFPRPKAFCRLGWWFVRGSLDRAIDQWRPDVVFAHHTVPGGITALWIKRRLGLPYIVQDFDFGSVEACERMPARRRVFIEVARGASAMLGASARISKAHAQLCPGVKAVPLYTGTHHPPAALWKTPRPAEISGKLVVFNASGMFARKDIPLLVKAFAEVARRHPNLVLRIAGDGPERPAVDAAVAQAGLGDRIQMLGMISHERVLQEMIWSDLFMLISWQEPFATCYLEAMSAAKPIICCNDGGICEVMQDGVQGFAIPPKNLAAAVAALERLVVDHDLRTRMAKAAGELFEQKLTLRSSAHTALQLLREAAANR